MNTLKLMAVLWLALSFSTSFSQTFDYVSAWNQVNDLQTKGLSAQAFEKVDLIGQQAAKEKNQVQWVKSLIHKTNYRTEYQEDALISAIGELNAALKKSEGVEQAMLSAALSDLYLQYYKNNQWTIRQIADVAGDAPNEIPYWSQRHFQEAISELIKTALSHEILLSQTPAEQWKEVFTSETDFLTFPTLFDFVAYKAISFYSSTEFSNPRTDDLSPMNQPEYFTKLESFKNVNLSTNQDLGQRQKVLAIYQKLIRQHISHKNTKPLLYEEASRFDFLLSHGQIDDKQNLITKLMEETLEQYLGEPGSNYIAQRLVNQLRSFNPTEKTLRQAKDICLSMIEKNLDKDYFQQELNELNLEKISLQMDPLILPQNPTLANFSYNNINEIFFRIVRIKESGFHFNPYEEGKLEEMLHLPVVKEFSYSLGSQKYLSTKSAAFELPILDYGHYAILASTRRDFSVKSAQISAGAFWVSNLQLLSQADKGVFLVVDRQTGQPLQGVKVQVYSNQWEYNTRSQVEKLEIELQTDKNGRFTFNQPHSSQIIIRISKGADEWRSPSMYINDIVDIVQSNEHHHFFTDRAIYRPGQTVHFKGVFINKKGNSAEPICNSTQEITLYGANGKKLQTLKLTSNEFGTVAGSFVLPLKGLTGNMRISSKNGSLSFRMEEYKRPKFEAIINQPAEEYQLNDNVQISGKASYYAGVGVQNAQVVYRVNRTSYMPWRWYSMFPPAEDLQIAAGITTTNETGDFQISFKAIAPSRLNEMQFFNYTIVAEITDASGETHSQSLNLTLGQTSLLLSANMPSVMDLENPSDVLIKSTNPQGKNIPGTISLKIEKYKPAENIFKTTGNKVDTILIQADRLKKEFGQWIFGNELPEAPVEALVMEKSLETRTDSILSKEELKNLKPGNYKMTLSGKDKNGKSVTEVVKFQLFSSNSDEMPDRNSFFSHIQTTQAKVGDTVVFSFGSSLKNLNYYYQLESAGRLMESGWMNSKNGLNHKKLLIQETDRGGISVEVFFVHENRFYKVSEQIMVPFDNKELDVRLVTMRNPMEPGSKERWTLWIRNHEEKPADAEVMATMYDASLNIFAENFWSLWPYYQYGSSRYWRNINSHFMAFENVVNQNFTYYSPETPSPLQFAWNNNYGYRTFDRMYAKSAPAGGRNMEETDVFNMVENDSAEEMQEETVTTKETPETKDEPVSARENLEETAFFFPQLRTDKEGYAQLNFTSPGALSRWKLMVMATTKGMEIGHITKELITQKEIMVMPNIPRFLRGGDQINLSTKVLNLTELAQKTEVTLEIFQAATNEPLSIFSSGQQPTHFVLIDAKGQAEVSWNLVIPEAAGAVKIRISAKTKTHTDGEEHMIPVLSQLHFLTDTYPFTLSAKNLLTPADIHLNPKDYQPQDQLTFEITTNPLWYVVQALPNFSLPQNPDALDWFNFYFIHSLGDQIVRENPQIKTVFEQWKLLSPTELQSELFQNEELKSVLAEETPWLLNAENETLRKLAIARLFETSNMEYQLETALAKLQSLQKPDGGFGWIEGMPSSVYISAQITQGFGQLYENQTLSKNNKNFAADQILSKLIKYLDTELENEHVKALLKKEQYYSVNTQILLARSWFLETHPLGQSQAAFDYFLNQWKAEKGTKSIDEKMNFARVLWLSGDKSKALEIFESLKDIALTDANGGLYWRDFQRNDAVNHQARMIGLFKLFGAEKGWIEGMQLWLLQNKRSNDWGDKNSTAQACFAMLSGNQKLSQSPKVYVNIGGKEMVIDGNAGTGYYKITWKSADIEKNLNGFTLRKEGEGMIFGAFYHQHFEKMSEVESHNGGVKIEKQVFVAKTVEGVNELIPLASGAQIQVGDRILVRMLIDNAQSMDYVHLRDYLPCGFENQNPLSGYQWKTGVGYYQSPGDLATNYFIGHLPKGLFLIEYQLFATQTGRLNLGPSNIQSVYAPEFGGHSSGAMIDVVK